MDIFEIEQQETVKRQPGIEPARLAAQGEVPVRWIR